MSSNLSFDEKKQRLAECEAEMTEHYYHFRRFEERAVQIAVERLYEVRDFSTFLSYYKSEWMEGEKISARKYQLLKYAESVGNIADILYHGIKSDPEIPLPNSERQTRPLAGLEPEQQAEVWKQAVEANDGNRPTGAQVEAVVAELPPTRLDFVDTDPGPKWIDARTSTLDKMPPGGNPKDPLRKPRFTEDVHCDGYRLNYQLIVPRGHGQSPLKWYGFMSRKQWEAAGLVFKGKPQHALDEEDFDAATDQPAPKKAGMDEGVRFLLTREKERLESIGAAVLFADKLKDCPPEDEEPLPGSFIAGRDMSHLDNFFAEEETSQ